MKTRIMALTFSLVFTSAACASTGANPFEGGVALRTVQVEVDNQNFSDATVYVLTNSGRQRLGVVQGKTKRTFVARLGSVGDVRLRVRLLAGASFTTRAMLATPGETLLLIVPSSLGVGGGG